MVDNQMPPRGDGWEPVIEYDNDTGFTNCEWIRKDGKRLNLADLTIEEAQWLCDRLNMADRHEENVKEAPHS